VEGDKGIFTVRRMIAMLYIMRHGKTQWNELHKMQGRTDIPLNEEGRQQAVKARELYGELSLDVCYASPLIRARETAEIFLEGKNVPIYLDERLVEMGMGICEGIEKPLKIPDCPIKPLFQDPAHYQPVERGESLQELYQRTGEFLEEKVMPLLKEGKNILIVGHGAMNCSIIGQIKNTPIDKFWDGMTDNCQIVRLI
jgi:probable phosphoglycerate mutase